MIYLLSLLVFGVIEVIVLARVVVRLLNR
jgi:hypothetical protein